MAPAVARLAFAHPRYVPAPNVRRHLARALRVCSSSEHVSAGPSDGTREEMAREVTKQLFHPGGTLESHLLRLPTPSQKVPNALLGLVASPEEPHKSIKALLHPRHKHIPDVENSLCEKCVLVPGDRRDHAFRLRCRLTNEYTANLFQIIGDTELSNSDYNAYDEELKHSLSRFDLFHAHCFVDRENITIGLLFHCHEYPAYNEDCFPHNLGFCQKNSTLPYDERKQQVRNILWCAKVGDVPGDVSVAFAALHTGEKNNKTESESANPLRALLTVPSLHTTYEGDFGALAGDFLYLDALHDRKPKHKLFAFPR